MISRVMCWLSSLLVAVTRYYCSSLVYVPVFIDGIDIEMDGKCFEGAVALLLCERTTSTKKGRLQSIAADMAEVARCVTINGKLLKLSMGYPGEGAGQKTLEIADDSMNPRKPVIHFRQRGDLRFVLM